jgi:type IV pilus assembly protein PilV
MMPLTTIPRPLRVRTQGGFSMLEVLISLVLIAIAMFGQAGLQMNALKFAKGASFRMQAVFLSNEIAERMESNHLGAAAGNYAVATSSTPTTFTTNCLTSPCNSSDLASYDLAEWESRIVAALPGPSWQINQTAAGTLSSYTITISWTVQRPNTDTVSYATAGTTETYSITTTKVLYQ